VLSIAFAKLLDWWAYVDLIPLLLFYHIIIALTIEILVWCILFGKKIIILVLVLV